MKQTLKSYIAGVIAAGNDANTIFIENGKYHGGIITQSILSKNKHHLSHNKIRVVYLDLEEYNFYKLFFKIIFNF